MEYGEVVNVFSKLVETHFLQRCPPVANPRTAAPVTPATPATPASASVPAASASPESFPECYKLPGITITGRNLITRCPISCC